MQSADFTDNFTKQISQYRKEMIITMSFSENLTYLRKRENITQEQFAEQLEVSRQSVSKWESGASYPEMEKLLQICDLFHCSLDVLMQGDAKQAYAKDSAGYDKQRNRFSRLCTAGTGVIIFGVSVQLFLTGIGIREGLCEMAFFIIAVIGIMILVVNGLQAADFKRRHPHVDNFYTEEEKDSFHRKFTVLAASGVGFILIGLILVVGCQVLTLPAGYTEELYYSVFILFAGLGACLFVYAGTQKSKFDIAEYNKKADPNSLSPEEKAIDSKIGTVCSCIMSVAAIVFFGIGFIGKLWEYSWLAFLFGGILCGIATIVLSARK